MALDTMLTNVAIYLRKSRNEEGGDMEETLSRHKAILLDYAKKHKLIISEADIFEEVVSGESLYARPQMQRLLERVENGDYDAVLCMDIDRLGRGGMRDQGIILDAFRWSGTLIITPEKTYNMNDETDEELTEFKAFMSRREYKIINKRLQRGLRQTVLEGGYIANAPFGYKKVRVNKQPTLEIVEEEAKYVRLIYDTYCQGVGASSIAETLNNLGSKPRRGDQWNPNSVRHILRNPVFSGKIRWNAKQHIRKGARGNDTHITVYNPPEKWIVVDGIHPAIITEEQFAQAQEIMKNRYIPSKRVPGKLTNPLSGLVHCHNCGRLMQRGPLDSRGRSGYSSLYCPTKNCIASARFDRVENKILENIQQELRRVELELSQEDPVDTRNEEKMVQATSKQLEQAQKQKLRLYELLEQNVYDIDTFRSRMAAVDEKIASLTEALREAKQTVVRAEKQDKAEMANRLRNALNAYSSADAQTKNVLLKTLIHKIIYLKEKKTKPDEFSIFIYYHTHYNEN